MLFLIIDDDPRTTEAIRAVLGHFPDTELRSFETAECALEELNRLVAARAPVPALMVAEVNLPGMSGTDFCRAVKAMPEMTEVPVIVVADGDDEALPAAFSAGAYDFIRKPIRDYELEVRAQAAIRLGVEASVRRSAMAMAAKELVFNQAVISSISNMGVGLLAIDRRRVTFVNPAFCQLTGWSEAELYAWPHYLPIFHSDEHARIASNHERRLRGETIPTRYETALHCRDGSRLDVEFSVSLWQSEVHDGVICLVRDIREELTMRKRLRDMAEIDALTGLPNRRLMQDRLEQALLHCDRAGSELAILFVDLDGFKAVNDTLGHAAGDELLRQVATRLQHGLRASDTAARMAGDEFVLILQQDADGLLDPVVVAKKLLQALRQPFLLDGHRAHISASVGIVKSHGSPDTPDGILRRADLAMYHVKQSGKDGYSVFDDDSQS